ncbi:beta-galactosidase [Paracidobacterium acidisoli]|uniref:Beta-galactosidase n=1 Tax=Paracidobacterium acidisoli TaxID=2303751 RepID=A0A372IPU3_9BACT|nr:beta-galactosidase [Paracidobacterium acidisoli]MBT9331220.1 beta-galactosidase [Paracidobacterium acidisoli]
MKSLRGFALNATVYLFLAAVFSGAFAAAQATRYADQPPLLVGAAWYPEQWPESQWEPDLERMEAAHIHLVRVGEFAWSTMEPSEGHYEFGWLDRAIALAAKHHICVVLGTPTAAPPAWLTTKYPETLRVSEDGVRDEHGNRQQFSFTDPKYRQLAHAIAEQMAMHFGHNADVVGWQLDNELANPSFDPSAKTQFHEWLEKKYGTIANLNQHWATAYWSQTYDNFDEIPVREDHENPGLLLEWKRFVSDAWKSYSENQISAIRPHIDARQFITTNTMGWFDGFDEYTLHTVLDIAAWDDYISTENYDYIDNAARHDLTRGFKNKNFWVMETEPAFVNWRPNNNALKRGQVRDMAWQAIGHGADAVEYWQWRSAPGGQEEYHGVLVGADGTPVPVYDEIRQTAEEFEKAGKALTGTTPHSEVALINDYDSRWAIDFQRHNQNFDPVEEMLAFYGPLREQSQAVDIISDKAPLDSYKLVEAPGLNVLPQTVADRLIAYVKNGGHLLLGPRSGMKDEYNALQPERQPGPLAGLLGGRVEQFYALDKDVPVSGAFGDGTVKIWAEQLSTQSPETKVLMTYGKSNGWLDDQPAVITRQVGKGSITYVGAWLDATLLDKLTASLLKESGVAPILPDVPEGVEVCRRSGEGRSVVILINHNTTNEHVSLPGAMTDLIAGGTAPVSSVDLPPYGVAVLSASR